MNKENEMKPMEIQKCSVCHNEKPEIIEFATGAKAVRCPVCGQQVLGNAADEFMVRIFAHSMELAQKLSEEYCIQRWNSQN